MKTETDTYIQWKQEHYDQDVIKSYVGYICHNPARKIPRLTASPHLRILPTSSNFSISLFLGIFGNVSPPPLKKGCFELSRITRKIILADFWGQLGGKKNGLPTDLKLSLRVSYPNSLMELCLV